MAEATLELRTILEAAERAAAAEDFVSAEQHLRQAATLQERQLGAGHPDLANTLNNLGIVSEYVGKPADAEACYRRAYRIAAAALPAEHPLVQTSGQNLRDFCEATGKPFELREELPELEPFASEAAVPRPQPKLASVPPPAPAKPAPQFVMPDLPLRTEGDRTPEQAARQPTSAKRTASPVSPSSNRPTAPIVIGVVLAIALAAWWFEFRESPRPAPAASSDEAPAPPRDAVTPREEPAPPPAAAQATPPPIAEATPKPAAPPAAPSVSESKSPPRRTESVATGDLSIVDAKVCRSLSTSSWTCTPATSPAAPGVFFFYTRIRSPRDATVQHRWSVDGRLVRSVNLRIAANPGAGYRTYTRNTVAANRRGNWTIELRDAKGALLHEERLTVR
jgi:hypothetical protein